MSEIAILEHLSIKVTSKLEEGDISRAVRIAAPMDMPAPRNEAALVTRLAKHP